MQPFSMSPLEMLANPWRHRDLVISMTKREVIGRYRGSIMGILWSFFTPVFMLVIYTFVFGYIFKSRWNPASESQSEFALVLFAGLIVFNLFAEVINRAPSLVLANPNYVKKVVFPLDILPWIALGASLFHAGVSLIVWLLAYVVLLGVPAPTVFLLPLVIFPLLFFILGIAWLLSSLGVFLRDISQFISIVTTTLMFLSPIFYPASALPEQYRDYLYLNPLTSVIEQAREVLYWGKLPDIESWFIYLSCSLLIACLGFAWFQKTRKGFADVI